MRILKSGILAVPLLILGAVRFVGDVDFIITRSMDPGWMKDVAEFFISPPIWFTEILFICGLLFAWYAIHISRRQPQPNAQSNVMHEESNLSPNMRMSSAIDYVISVLFPDKQSNVGLIDIENRKAAELITAKARSGELKTWGKYVGELTERPLKKEDWEFRELRLLESSIPTDRHPQTRSVRSDLKQGQFTALRVNR